MNFYHMSMDSWVLVVFGAFLVGFSKTGVGGLGIFSAAIYATIFPARESTGILLPLLICGDIVAVGFYRRHAVWSHLWRLFPWAALGIILGTYAMDKISDLQVRHLIGWILLFMVGFHFVRKYALKEDLIPHQWWFSMLMGLFAGFTTMVANAAGPIMTLYLLAMSLPKMEFLGTGAWYFFILNTFKIPFSWHLGLISSESLWMDLKLAPWVWGGALIGRWVVNRIHQTLFELLALAMTVLMAIKLVLK